MGLGCGSGFCLRLRLRLGLRLHSLVAALIGCLGAADVSIIVLEGGQLIDKYLGAFIILYRNRSFDVDCAVNEYVGIKLVVFFRENDTFGLAVFIFK